MGVNSFDPRVVKLGLQIGNDLKTYEGLYVTASGSKYANPLANECEIKVANLSKADRDYIVTETSPFNRSKKKKQVFLWVGRQSQGIQLLFHGDIVTTAVSQPPDIMLTLRCKTGYQLKGDLVSTSMAGTVPLSNIAKTVARAADLMLDFQAKDKNIANYSFTGSKAAQIERLQELGAVDAFQDDQTLVIKDRGKALKNTTNVLSAESGMIGVPMLTDQGVKVTYLLDRASRIGSELDIRSDLNPAVNGKWTVFKLDFEVSSRDTPFYYIAEGRRPFYAK